MDKLSPAEFVFGARLSKTLGLIAETAAIQNTPEAWEQAYYRASGISWLINDLDDAKMRLVIDDFMYKLKQCSTNESLRHAARRAFGLDSDGE